MDSFEHSVGLDCCLGTVKDTDVRGGNLIASLPAQEQECYFYAFQLSPG